MALVLTPADRALLRLPPPPAGEIEELPPTHCSDCGDALCAEDRAGRCDPCNLRARRKFYAARYAREARNGQEVPDDLDFAWFLPAALARRGKRLERDGLRWVVRS